MCAEGEKESVVTEGGGGRRDGEEEGVGGCQPIYLSSSTLPPSFTSLSLALPPTPPLSVTASHSGSVELGIMHLIRSLMHF